jgi:asparagine synthase (glutamine-hydrolysing)
VGSAKRAAFDFASRVGEAHWELWPQLQQGWLVVVECCDSRQVAHRRVPDSIVPRPKQPYRAPDGKSFLGPESRHYVDELTSPGTIRKYEIFDPTSVSALMSKFRKGQAIRVKDNMAMVGVISTQLVMQQFVERRPVA